MANEKKAQYVLAENIGDFAAKLIAELNHGGKTVSRNRCSLYLCFARENASGSDPVEVSMVENKMGIDQKKPFYTVLVLNCLDSGPDRWLFNTKELTKEALVEQLRAIWNDLSGNAPNPTQEAPAPAVQTENAKPNCMSEPEICRCITGSRDAEFSYLKAYISGCCLDDETSVTFLYSLWVAYCLHQNLTVDTSKYKEALTELWDALVESDGGKPSHWEDFTDFDINMSRDLRQPPSWMHWEDGILGGKGGIQACSSNMLDNYKSEDAQRHKSVLIYADKKDIPEPFVFKIGNGGA